MEASPIQIIISLTTLLLALTVHEWAHAWTAWKLGDNVAKDLGRVTLNPIPHIDPFMTIFVPALLIFSGSPVIFGGAKPVPFNPNSFKNPKKDTVIVAAAGPISNFILGFLSYLVLLLLSFMSKDFTTSGPGTFLILFFSISIFINAILALFNLIPIPPLDGGRIAVGLLPDSLSQKLSSLEPYGLMIVIGLLYFKVIGSIIDPVFAFLYSIMPIQ